MAAGHAHVVEEQLGGVLAVEADLLEVAATFEAGHAALDDEQRHPAVALRRVGLGGDDHQVGVDAVGDERLRPVQDVLVAVADRGGGDAGEVGAGAGLGHRDGGDQLAGRRCRAANAWPARRCSTR